MSPAVPTSWPWRLRPVVLLACALLCTAAVAASPPDASTPEVTNLVPAFLRFMETARTADPDRRYELWKETYLQPNRHVFEAAILKQAFADSTCRPVVLRSLDRIFTHYEEHHRAMSDIAAEAPGILRRCAARLQEEFPDAGVASSPCLLLVGIGTFNARADTVDGRDSLVLGAEMFGAAEGLPIVLSHELFHLYHLDRYRRAGNAIEERLYFPLLFEGCAVWYSRQANPASSLRDCLSMGTPAYLGLDLLPGYEANCARLRPGWAAELLGNLDRAGCDDLYARYFSAAPDAADRPARAGYALGYWVVARLVDDGIPLGRIVSAPRAELVALCRRGLESLARGSDDGRR